MLKTIQMADEGTTVLPLGQVGKKQMHQQNTYGQNCLNLGLIIPDHVCTVFNLLLQHLNCFPNTRILLTSLIYHSDDGITATLKVSQKNLSPYRPGELLPVGELFGTHGSIKHTPAVSPAFTDQPCVLEDCLCVSALHSSAHFTHLARSSLHLSDLIVHPQLQSSVKRLYPPYFSSVNS